jgi:DNA-binding transcriptional regulator WhiA
MFVKISDMYTFHKFGKDYSILRKEAVQHYNDGLKCKQIATKMDLDRRTVGKWLKEEGFTYSRCNKAAIDSSVFDNIDSSEKAYWLGFIFADGYVSKDNNFELSLALKDLEHLIKFKEFLKYEGKIYIDQKIGRCRLQFQDSRIVNSLKNLGCVNRKSLILTFPSIDNCFHSHFIRGYFDGDGSVNDPKRSIAVNLVGTKEFLESIHEVVGIPKYKIKHRQPKHSPEVYISQFSGEHARAFGGFIYVNSTIHLTRKHERFIKHLEKNL